jgi:hypothetical protein
VATSTLGVTSQSPTQVIEGIGLPVVAGGAIVGGALVAGSALGAAGAGDLIVGGAGSILAPLAGDSGVLDFGAAAASGAAEEGADLGGTEAAENILQGAEAEATETDAATTGSEGAADTEKAGILQKVQSAASGIPTPSLGTIAKAGLVVGGTYVGYKAVTGAGSAIDNFLGVGGGSSGSGGSGGGNAYTPGGSGSNGGSGTPSGYYPSISTNPDGSTSISPGIGAYTTSTSPDGDTTTSSLGGNTGFWGNLGAGLGNAASDAGSGADTTIGDIGGAIVPLSLLAGGLFLLYEMGKGTVKKKNFGL